MEDITKALQDLAKALEENDSVHRVTVSITLVKPNKAKESKSE